MTTTNAAERTTVAAATSTGGDIGLLILRIGLGAAVLQAALMKATDFGTTVGYLEAGGWRLPALAAFMVTAAELLGAVGLLLGILTPLAACAVLGAMLCAWAVNVSGGAFWSEPFNVPFLLAVGAAALLFTGAGAYSVDARVAARLRWTPRMSVFLLVVAVVAAVVTWIALNGTNPIHL
jgi:uncharacterized membrane protein YphA (DoxX/SURF4 family)